MDRDRILELVKDENKLKEYEDFVKSLPEYQRANYIDPNILKGARREYLRMQEAEKEVAGINEQITQVQSRIAQVEQEIKQKKEEIEKDKDGLKFNVAKDMYSGDYIKVSPPISPVKYSTETERRTKNTTEWNEPTEWDVFRINHKDKGEITNP